VELGWRNGFDSGLSLDYVYENTPRGVTALGRLIDKSYLDSIGWRGIRQRKAHLEKALRDVIQKTHGENRRFGFLISRRRRPLCDRGHSGDAGNFNCATLCDNKRENVDALAFSLTNSILMAKS